MDKTVLISLPVEDLQTLIIDSVNTCLKLHKSQVKEIEQSDEILNVKEASEFLKLAIPTIYSLTSNRVLPHSKRGKKLYFSKTELTLWIQSGRRSTVNDLKKIAKKHSSI